LKKTFLFFLAIVTLISCKDDKAISNAKLEGGWLVLYPDHKQLSSDQKKSYAGVQDSVVGLLGLKILRFDEKGKFSQADSLYKTTGEWELLPDNVVNISNAGKGLNVFYGKEAVIEKGILKMSEKIDAGAEQVPIVWNLKKITNKNFNILFTDEGNSWRKHPPAAEDKTAITKRLLAMLQYYSLYYELVSESSTFFIRHRVHLPFKYYQHGVGMEPFETDTPFASYYYNDEQALEAYNLLSKGMSELSSYGKYPSDKNYVIEYSLFMTKMKETIEAQTSVKL
jgi:hypothetical protein